ncbi:MAG TPA: hypothetical protein VNK95_25340 [Caldilineaceae bacterium]|nr:hypothetical protein [Caldilineaceae bacterium]
MSTETPAVKAEAEAVTGDMTGGEKKGRPKASLKKAGAEKMNAEKMNTENTKSEATTTGHPSPEDTKHTTSQATSVERLAKAMEELRKPFHPSHITWKPGVVAKSGDKALALAYADVRAYQNRLDEVCGANWSVSYTPWGERIICNLTIFGVTRSSTGEPDGDSERNEISGTVAEAQAFKRACAMFGLGRYLYTLPSVWAEYDKERRQFTEPAKAKLLGILMQHYRRHADPKAEMAELFHDEEPANGASNGELEPLRRQFDELGRSLYGDQWDIVCRRNVQRISGGQAKTTGELSGEQIQKLIEGMKKLMRQREAV